jgi:hypothetical protein
MVFNRVNFVSPQMFVPQREKQTRSSTRFTLKNIAIRLIQFIVCQSILASSIENETIVTRPLIEVILVKDPTLVK